MRSFLRLGCILAMFLLVSAWRAQCTIANYLTAYRIPVASYPYFSVSAGVTVSVTTIGVSNLTDFSYPCNGSNYSGASPTWWLNASNQAIILNFSAPVTRFTVLVNGTNATEIFYYFASSGSISLSDYCPTGMIATGAQVQYTPTAAGGSIISINNATGATSYTMTHNGTGSGSRVTLLDCFLKLAPLPVELTEFKAWCRNEKEAEFRWTTQTETGNAFFTLEQSNDGKSWLEVARVNGAGSSYQAKNYSLRLPFSGESLMYYRLRQTDINNNSRTFDEIFLEASTSANDTELNIFPVPASNELIIKTNIYTGYAVIRDQYGKECKRISLEGGENLVDISNIENGYYFLYLENKDKVIQVKKIAIQK